MANLFQCCFILALLWGVGGGVYQIWLIRKIKRVKMKKWTLANNWVLASNNAGKLQELQQLFNQKQLPVSLVPQAQLGVTEAIEDGLSYIENALIKARHASDVSGLPAIADDSGLSVPVLGGKPGIYSARYASQSDRERLGIGQNIDQDTANITKLLAELLPYRPSLTNADFTEQRATNDHNSPIIAMFVCVLVMVRHADDPLPLIAQGFWHGQITDKPMGDQGFGYDPIFWLPQQGMSAAQLDQASKNRLSHRGQACHNLLQQICTFIDL